jgi:hypothetical protein
MIEWDDPSRTRRIDDATGKEITPEEWSEWEWYDVTLKSSPQDAHVYIKLRRKGEMFRRVDE